MVRLHVYSIACLALGSLFALSTDLSAQNAAAQTIAGRVIDEFTNDPIGEAHVVVRDSSGSVLDTATSDGDGAFRFRVDPGRYSFAVRAVGFAPIETGPVDIAVGQTVDLTITMSVRLVTLEPVVIEGDSARDARGPLVGFYERVERGMGLFVVREEVELRQPTKITDILYGKSGVRIYSIRGELNKKMVRIGGARCTPMVWLDGTRVSNIEDRDLDELIYAYDLEGLEVYTTSQIPAEFHGGDTRCGVIVLWTTRG